MPILDRAGDVVGEIKVDPEDVERVQSLGPVRLDGRGYAIVNVSHPVIPGRHYTLGVHRFLAGAEYGDGCQVDHINHDIMG